MDAGCSEIQPVTEMADYGLSNAMFMDPFGYIWMLHQIHREVSFEERVKLWEEKGKLKVSKTKHLMKYKGQHFIDS